MTYGLDILINGDAETQDTTGWTITPNGSVTVEENTTLPTQYIAIVDDLEDDLDNPWLTLPLEGPAGDYNFMFESENDITMSQILYASDIGAQPESFQFNCKFKLVKPQDYWDTTVFGFAQLKIEYDDGTFDYFMIPFVKGAEHEDRYVFNFWIVVSTVCTVNVDKTLVSATVAIRSINCNKGLKIEYIELRKEE
jgi:hypothetical protein